MFVSKENYKFNLEFRELRLLGNKSHGVDGEDLGTLDLNSSGFTL